MLFRHSTHRVGTGIVYPPPYRLSNRRVDRFLFSLLSAFMLFSARVHGSYMLFHPERRQDMDLMGGNQLGGRTGGVA